MILAAVSLDAPTRNRRDPPPGRPVRTGVDDLWDADTRWVSEALTRRG